MHCKEKEYPFEFDSEFNQNPGLAPLLLFLTFNNRLKLSSVSNAICPLNFYTASACKTKQWKFRNKKKSLSLSSINNTQEFFAIKTGFRDINGKWREECNNFNYLSFEQVDKETKKEKYKTSLLKLILLSTRKMPWINGGRPFFFNSPHE